MAVVDEIRRGDDSVVFPKDVKAPHELYLSQSTFQPPGKPGLRLGQDLSARSGVTTTTVNAVKSRFYVNSTWAGLLPSLNGMINFGKPKTVGDWIIHIAGAIVAIFLVSVDDSASCGCGFERSEAMVCH